MEKFLVMESAQSTSSSLTYREDQVMLQTVSLGTGAVFRVTIGVGGL